ncbi:MAG: hypothetical protein QM570_19030 [Planctomycetota bacterium]|jgi:hypothetical protein|nr:hypothetical protein [Planctomycetota bacterium]
MTTESDTIRQNADETKLTTRQAKFLPVLLASPTYTHACRKGRISRDTLYEWLRQPEFKAELDRRRAELVAQGFALLSQSVTKAVETLVSLLDTGDGRLKRLAAKDILDQHIKFRELDDLTRRIETIEQRLLTRG